MSLYYDAVTVLTSAANIGGSFKSRLYNSKNLKSPPAQIYALVAECAKWDHFLKEVIENAQVLEAERKLTPMLALFLTHDLLLSRRGVAAPANHPLRVTIEKHRVRLRAEFTKLRVKRGCATVEDLQALITREKPGAADTGVHPRWVRVNNVVTTLEHELETTFAGYARVKTLAELEQEGGDEQAAKEGKKGKNAKQLLYLDDNVKDLLAVPQSTDLTKLRAYKDGRIILQDKASCFPAYLLLGDEGLSWEGKLVDGCAAPGNKTTHLASLLCSNTPLEKKTETASEKAQRIFALDHSKMRSKTLKKMVGIAKADGIVNVLEGQDFLGVNPKDKRFRGVTGLLLDPSCSGSGIQGRDDVPTLALPEAKPPGDPNSKRSKKRKRSGKDKNEGRDAKRGAGSSGGKAAPGEENEMSVAGDDTERLIKLSNLQTRIVEHALSFPLARRVTYSTCSIHGLENENVVARVLGSEVARRRGWRVLKRSEQPSGLREWKHRGVKQDGKVVEDANGQAIHWELGQEELDACLRCYQGGEEGTGGFFVAGFVRDGGDDDVEEEEEEEEESEDSSDEGEGEDGDDADEWSGFSD